VITPAGSAAGTGAVDQRGFCADYETEGGLRLLKLQEFQRNRGECSDFKETHGAACWTF
jgi:hypothetical protein